MNSRDTILTTAFLEFYKNGYNATGIQTILEKSGLTRGALYHHFNSKQELILAAITERIGTFLEQVWIAPMENSDDPLLKLKELIQSVKDPFMKKNYQFEFQYGCPLYNTIQEIAREDPEVSKAVKIIYEKWEKSISNALKKGIKNNRVRKNIDPEHTAAFILASLEGCIMTAKIDNSKTKYTACISPLLEFINSLKK
ncbi:MAG: TetR/AcrR family transcriptional regulator [Spirochaetia bacterium]|nr:TetR/AcrR family transcriptional regulator [Spirochaetia bacterium]